MKKLRILIPEPKSRFLRIKCPNCGNEQTIFSHSTFPVRCLSCGTELVYSVGGKAKIVGEVVRIMG
ncbi:Ribosomal protein S27E [Sulfolobus islandicus Y.G.57.14]|jgi:small subunit ribosomal protein S27e|uniref:Small ribosomal subunit protein eS27 n=10 Tax=Saccharolobus islandicus TaxID=43080 RepID=M9U8S8_SACIS|nr:30S ribosomal protein S27e [Sulfolobus islandicus]ACP35277.1 Ribosomal protein S27E [Sulfolobus islandicus L.S.2.15]ACP37931.1 Ribosomal protein S27E [Sulfolobus islandicus M.14.25]ACP45433.1 Ribosomal protein S27E [Sulfolobus islandicus Y.G.57.14]ACP48767.1 Ribosomal protein S27E [Sulfolobus islandicus Y.N.15.51]ACP55121.1 Ribosomal protein S27E [Sulfolobus islandicus M.16.27]